LEVDLETVCCRGDRTPEHDLGSACCLGVITAACGIGNVCLGVRRPDCDLGITGGMPGAADTSMDVPRDSVRGSKRGDDSGDPAREQEEDALEKLDLEYVLGRDDPEQVLALGEGPLDHAVALMGAWTLIDILLDSERLR